MKNKFTFIRKSCNDVETVSFWDKEYNELMNYYKFYVFKKELYNFNNRSLYSKSKLKLIYIDRNKH